MPTIPLNLDIGEGHTLDSLLDALSGHYEELEGFLIGDLSRHSFRAEYSDESLTLDGVYPIERNTYSLQYSYEWSAHYGCKDMNHGDTQIEEIRFKYVKGVAKFQKEEHEPRSTYEEF